MTEKILEYAWTGAEVLSSATYLVVEGTIPPSIASKGNAIEIRYMSVDAYALNLDPDTMGGGWKAGLRLVASGGKANGAVFPPSYSSGSIGPAVGYITCNSDKSYVGNAQFSMGNNVLSFQFYPYFLSGITPASMPATINYFGLIRYVIL